MPLLLNLNSSLRYELKFLRSKKDFPAIPNATASEEHVLFKPRRQGFLLALPKRNKRLGVFSAARAREPYKLLNKNLANELF
jgi:hypothetical protein